MNKTHEGMRVCQREKLILKLEGSQIGNAVSHNHDISESCDSAFRADPFGYRKLGLERRGIFRTVMFEKRLPKVPTRCRVPPASCRAKVLTGE